MKKFVLMCLLALPLTLAGQQNADASGFKIGFGVGVGVSFSHGCLSLSVYGAPIFEAGDGGCGNNYGYWGSPCPTYGAMNNAFGPNCGAGHCGYVGGDYVNYAAPAATPNHVYYNTPSYYPVNYYPVGYQYQAPSYWYGR